MTVCTMVMVRLIVLESCIITTITGVNYQHPENYEKPVLKDPKTVGTQEQA